MKFKYFQSTAWFAGLAAIALLLVAATAARAAANDAAPATTATVSTNSASGTDTNAAPKELPIPRSTFELTANTHDPFFPNSLRHAAGNDKTNAVAGLIPSNFQLKGLSGPAGKRLAVINNRTFGPGEKYEVTTATGKVIIRCEEIKENSVLIRTEGMIDPVEIFMRKTAQ